MGLFDKLNDVAKTAAASAKNAASTAKEQASALGANEALDKLKGAAGDATQKAKGVVEGLANNSKPAEEINAGSASMSSSAPQEKPSCNLGDTSTQAQTQEPSRIESATQSQAEEHIAFPRIDLCQMTLSLGKTNPTTENPIAGQARTFSLASATLSVSEELDKYIAYLVEFASLADELFPQFERRYRIEVHDLQSFCDVVPAEYCLNRKPLIDKATAYLFSEGIWDVSHEEMIDLFMAKDSIFARFWKELTQQAVDANAAVYAGADLFGAAVHGSVDWLTQSLAQRGAAGSAASWLFGNTVGEALSSSADDFIVSTKSEINLTVEQATKIYDSIDHEALLRSIHADNRLSGVLLAAILCAKGVPIWKPDDAEKARASIMLENLRQADFSQEVTARAMCETLLADPFNKEAYVLLDEKLPGSPEVAVIKDYFSPGFVTEFDY